MEFADVNWTVIAIATGLNMLIGYLFFESRLARSLNKKTPENKEGSLLSPLNRYFNLVLYSTVISAFYWVLIDELTLSIANSMLLLWLLVTTTIGITRLNVSQVTKMHKREFWFFYVSIFLTMIVVAFGSLQY